MHSCGKIKRPKKQNFTGNSSQNSKIKIPHINIKGLKNKTHELAMKIAELNPHFVTISEHNLSPGNINQTLLSRYKILDSFWRINHKEGGIAILKKDDLHLKLDVLNSELFAREMHFEPTGIKFKTSKLTYVAMWY